MTAAPHTRVTEFLRQYRDSKLRRVDPVICAVWTDNTTDPVDLTVADLEQLLQQARPVTIPDRIELAFALYDADNWRQTTEQNRREWGDPTTKRQYAFVLADAAIEAFKRANP